MTIRPLPTLDQLVELYEAGRLAEELGAYHDGAAEGSTAFAQACTQAHNDGRIDLLAVVQQPAFVALEPHAFFAAQQVYCDAIPHLKADVESLMECCRLLVQRAGQDAVGSMPNGAFREWCANHRDQASRVVADAVAGKAPAMEFATFALQGRNDVPQAVAFVEQFTDERRLYGMTALGQMSFPDTAAAHAVLAVLEPFCDVQSEDRVRANALAAAFGILARHPDLDAARRIVEAVVRQPGADTLHVVAQLLSQRHVALESQTTRTALGAMCGIRKDSPGTVRQLSSALYRMLGTPDEALALDALSDMMDAGECSVEDFGMVLQKIGSGPAERRHALVVRWLLSGSLRLGNAVSHVEPHRRDGEFGIEMALPELNDAQAEFLCCKAVGFLFMRPRSCCAVLVAVLRTADERGRAFAGQLLVNPMLMSFGGVQDYLATVPDTDPAFPHVQAALERFRQHRAALDAIDDIKELRPSERQRHLARERSGDQMREAFKSAEQSSLLRELFHHTHVLHGRRTLTFVDGPDGTRRAFPMDLKPHSTSIELPSLEWLDPVGLDYLLRSWRVLRQP